MHRHGAQIALTCLVESFASFILASTFDEQVASNSFTGTTGCTATFSGVGAGSDTIGQPALMLSKASEIPERSRSKLKTPLTSDPEGNKNYIRVVTQFHGDRIFVSATLTNEQYQHALDAHSRKQQVRLKGNGIRLKTLIRVAVFTEFTT